MQDERETVDERVMNLVELALAKGKRLFDKREAIKKREIQREIERALKSRK